MSDTRTPTDVHTYFGLSYVEYVFIPQALADQMPAAWARDFTRLRHQLRDAFAHLEPPVPARYLGFKAELKSYGELMPDELERLGLRESARPEDDHDPEGRQILLYTDSQGREHQEWEELMAIAPDAEPVSGFGFHRTLLQSMPEAWQHAFVTLLQEAFAAPGAAELYSEFNVVPQNLIGGHWRDVAETIPGYRRGRTRLTPRLETS